MFLETSRFRPVRRLGEGGMGIVYEVEDRERGEHVALKTLKRPTAELTYRLKREFRALAELQHPNLVALHELFVEGDSCFFTMELLVGRDLLAHVRNGDRPLALADTQLAHGGLPEPAPRETPPAERAIGCDEARLRRVLPQLVRGLAALHAAGKVHRDIKPSNVLVTAAGRLVVLDFGLVTHADRERDRSVDGDVVGTVAYMSPEQARGDPASPASDWYSVGVVLYEALTGQLPFSGPTLRVLLEKQQHPAPPPRALVPEAPADLDALCTSLLDRAERQRPDGEAVLRRLGITADPDLPRHSVSFSGAAGIPFAGREAELARLAQALGSTARLEASAVVVVGESGIGKSTLIREFLDRTRISHPGRVVLEGRCYEREAVAYQAMDSLIDHLSTYWRGLPAEEAEALVPREAALLPRLFPVLGRVPAIAGAPAGPAIADPQEVRTRAFAALRDALGRLADRHPLVLVLDDMQWSDASTLTLLSDLMRPPRPPGLLLVLASRPEATGRLGALVAHMDAKASTIELLPLPAAPSLELARKLLGPSSDHRAERVVLEAAGNPFFIGELAQYAQLIGEHATEPLQLEGALQRRIAQLPAQPRRLLELLALAGEPVAMEVLGTAAGAGRGALAQDTGVLRTMRLAKVTGPRHAPLIEPYHDRIRDAVLSSISPEGRRELYRSLALAAAEQAAPERMATYWRGAGEDARAARYASTAADEALERLDFDRAADLYRMSLLLGGHSVADRRALLVSLGHALSHAGRPANAAQAFRDAAEENTSSVAALELQRRSAEELLRGGYLEEGLAAIEQVLRAAGLRLSTPTGALARMLARRAWLRVRGLRWRTRDASELSQRALTLMDTCWSVTLGLSVVDNIQSASYSAQHLAYALAVGEPTRLARAFGMEAVFLASQGHGDRARACVEHARTLSDQHDDAYGRAWAAMGQAATGFFADNQWRRSLEGFVEAERRFRTSQSAGWEVDSAQTWSCFNRLYLGELEELSRLVPGYAREAERRGDLYQQVNLRTRLGMVHLAADRAEGCREELEGAIEAWMPRQTAFQVQHFFALHGRGEILLYRGDAAGAAAEVEGQWPALRRSLLLHVLMVRAEMVHLRARIELSLAASPGAGTGAKRARQAARRHAAQLRRTRIPLARAWAILVEAGAAHAEGDDGRAADLLREAVSALDELETRLYAYAARQRLGALLGGDEGARLCAEASTYFSAQGVVNPARMVALLVPGWPHPDHG